MTRRWTLTLALFVALAFLAVPLGSARAGVFVGVGIPGPWYGPYHHHHPYYYYGPRLVVTAPPLYYTPAPVYVAPAPAPVYVQPAPTVVQTAPAPAVVPVPQPAPVNPGN